MNEYTEAEIRELRDETLKAYASPPAFGMLSLSRDTFEELVNDYIEMRAEIDHRFNNCPILDELSRGIYDISGDEIVVLYDYAYNDLLVETYKFSFPLSHLWTKDCDKVLEEEFRTYSEMKNAEKELWKRSQLEKQERVERCTLVTLLKKYGHPDTWSKNEKDNNEEG